MIEENLFFEEYISQSGLKCNYTTKEEIQNIKALKILLQETSFLLGFVGKTRILL